MAKAEKGDLIRIVKAEPLYEGSYKVGDILEVYEASESGSVVVTRENPYGARCGVVYHEYEIHRKAGEEDSEAISYEGATALFAPGETVISKADAEELLNAVPTQDAVEHPIHYTQGRFETIEVIEEITQGYSDGYVAYCVGNALKYLARAPHKHAEPTEDLRKAAKYLEFAIGRLTQD